MSTADWEREAGRDPALRYEADDYTGPTRREADDDLLFLPPTWTPHGLPADEGEELAAEADEARQWRAKATACLRMLRTGDFHPAAAAALRLAYNDALAKAVYLERALRGGFRD